MWAAGRLSVGIGNFGRVIAPVKNDALFDCTLENACASANPQARTTAELQHPREFDELDYDLDTTWGFRAWSTYACLRFEPTCGNPPQACDDHCACHEHGHSSHHGHHGHGAHCEPVVDAGVGTGSATCGVGVCLRTGGTGACVDGWLDGDACTPGLPTGDDSVCNGLDDDCDGLVDESFVGTSIVCGTGACQSTGTTSCVAGHVVSSCDATTSSNTDASCDGVDDDCDGHIDEDFVPTSTTCGVGVCASTGSTSCVAGVVHDGCSAGSPSGTDSVCNGLDDDCDGDVDEGYAPTQTSCGTGACAATGATSCAAGTVVDSCAAGAGTSVDASCDGIDDDCDGHIDEDFVATSTTCGVGVCAASGSTSCVAGVIHDSCAAGVATGTDAVCDGLDNDCDGSVDEAFAPTTTSCGVGVCAAAGVTSCAAGTIVDSCTAAAPTGDDSSCNALDDDCDGQTDEAYVSTPTSCGAGVCSATGATSCSNGAVVDSCVSGAPTGNDSVCNALDEDCDGQTDEAYVSAATSCGIGVCAASGGTSCVSGAVVDSCAPGAATGDDSSCNALDDDCDGSVDEAYASVNTICGVGVCAASGSTSCVGGAVVDSCTAGAATGDDSTCNALDDDCDGSVDEAYASVNTTCGVGVCAAAGSSACSNGTVVDSCAAGTATGNDSQCNALDDDCDGSVDEAYVATETTCGLGVCAAFGTTSCSNGAAVDSCSPGAATGDDSSCNALDDDCDGQTDESFAPASTTCGVGVCAAVGETACLAGHVTDSCSVGSPTGDDSACNAQDDDCDGLVDEAYVSLSTSCGLGVCAASGMTACVLGSVVDSCLAGPATGDDCSCNALDDDCDGETDEAFVATSTSCGVGVCASAGLTACLAGIVTDSCLVGVPTGIDSTCDGVDDDCDGSVDEAFGASSTTCGIGPCSSSGTLTCVAGMTVNSCVAGTPAASDATCDGVDDNCDGVVDEACCTPTNCVDAGAGCGTISDGCGGTLSCGGCQAGEQCGSDAFGQQLCVPLAPPPSPSSIAPSPDGVDLGFFDAFSFLLGPVQQGADLASMDPQRAALVRGRVLTSDLAPIAGVRVRVEGHPEYGYTFTRADGQFDLLVEGGGPIAIDYDHSLYLPVQRRVTTDWSNAVVAPDVVLTRRSPTSKMVVFGASTMQVLVS